MGEGLGWEGEREDGVGGGDDVGGRQTVNRYIRKIMHSQCALTPSIISTILTHSQTCLVRHTKHAYTQILYTYILTTCASHMFE